MAEPLSIWELIVNASLVVQLVMGTLMLASLLSWIMIFQRGFSLTTIRREALAFEDEFWSGKDLRQLYMEMQEEEADFIGVEHIFTAGFKEFSRLRGQEGADPERVMQNVQRAMRVALSREEEIGRAHV